ncbi:serine hydrolase [Ochrobactrum pecoris]|uniref:CubicO group peptidase (Beta-lactamase class C family) n=1 Tax=Brucella pecoris TaxID=867683 RepID=A0A5C5CJI3_9HYPH|nr:serine hydrolase [Brucella pecoris]MBB4094767.1 CubicO group peptidase (beta-lactamase class C family) [Brucella pecoris]NKW80239.1 serine hydrolase [Brucella pecoris]TNV11294.1 serine hydrolase [Brucella pecoris]
MKRILKSVVCLLLAIVLGVILWLAIRPPELLRVGTGYAAKIVCSNVFIANRDADIVLADDVQAPGNPLLRFLNISIDKNSSSVTVRIFGFFAPGTAAYRPALGCANIHKDDLRLELPTSPQVPAEPIQIETDPKVQAVIEDQALAGPGMRAIAVIHDGKLIAENYASGFNADTPLLGWSMTKSVIATLIGMRIAEGRMTMESTGLLPEWKNDERAKISLANLMAMNSGLRFDEDYGTVADVTRMLYLETDMAGFAASLPLESAPGTKFNYSSGTASILSKLFMDSFNSREEALSYPRLALFGPLGMRSTILETDASGVFAGSSYMYATARDWARLGAFLADGGNLYGKPVLPPDFISFMRKPTLESEGRYGSAQVWLQIAGVKAGQDGIPEDAFWMSGHDGQSVMIVPSMHLAVVRLGLTPSRTHYNVQRLNAKVIEAVRQAR